MPYTEVTFLLSPVDPWRDLLQVELADIGFDSFEDGFTDPIGPSGELKAYISSDRFNESKLSTLLTLRDPHVAVNWSALEIADRNWNAEWESSFQPVEVGDFVRIRADFHEAMPGFTHDLIITPRMAFGTGHHATTRMMVQAMKGLDLTGKKVCDLGCGTGVLAILAERMGATEVLAIDIDPGAVENARHNAGLNGCHAITVEKGVADSLKGLTFDAILANIERNVLLDAMPLLAAAMRPGAALFLSGFVPGDRHMLAQRAKDHGLELAERMQEGEWALLGCRK
ncbi:MAG: 50S ribosomal protein L11 methyltransferase [Flavobacteriales bacterium]|nr:50S ribosomal protein L11 methyltransferase [Flavobacteriales bacterium]MCC6938604.1 50S ribosomal protein L11 methyltransferase [Flavobacteriales bacterium]